MLIKSLLIKFKNKFWTEKLISVIITYLLLFCYKRPKNTVKLAKEMVIFQKTVKLRKSC